MSPQLLSPAHPLPRRSAIQAGAAGILGLGGHHLSALRQLAADEGSPAPHQPKAVISIFLSGGLAQHDSFDPKPDATIYQALGLPKSIVWKDAFERPHQVYHGEPIAGLL